MIGYAKKTKRRNALNQYEIEYLYIYIYIFEISVINRNSGMMLYAYQSQIYLCL